MIKFLINLIHIDVDMMIVYMLYDPIISTHYILHTVYSMYTHCSHLSV